MLDVFGYAKCFLLLLPFTCPSLRIEHYWQVADSFVHKQNTPAFYNVKTP
jgi:hypothetical protein